MLPSDQSPTLPDSDQTQTATTTPITPASSTPGIPPGNLPGTPPATPPKRLLFGRYRFVRELGRGGMGIVYLAQDEVLGVPVALKMVPDQVLRDTEGIADLKKEVLRGMALTHPGIVRVFSFEQDEEGAAIVMEWVEGKTLAELKASQPHRCFDSEQVRPWLEQLCSILDYAHADARIAHRDLKPSNIILGSNGKIKVADFGISSSLSDTLTRISVRTDNAGTPAYMSPQQAMGERPSHLDDLYALGATFYELLTGKPPFFRGNILAQAMEETPSTMTDRRTEFEILGMAPIPESWERAVLACLSKEPTERPVNAAAVLALLQAPAAKRSEPAARSQPVASHTPQNPRKSQNPQNPQNPPESALPEPIIRVPRPAISPVTVVPMNSYHANSSGPGMLSFLLGWFKTLVLVIVAGALTAGGLHQFRQWKGAQPVAAKASSAEPVSKNSATPSRLNIGRLEERHPK